MPVPVRAASDLDDEVGPQVTIAMRASAQAVDMIEREIVAALPIAAGLDEAWLVALSWWPVVGATPHCNSSYRGSDTSTFGPSLPTT